MIHGVPVAATEVIDREQTLGELLAHADAGQPARLSAPRRYGKTSLLRRLLAEADKGGMTTVYVDLYKAISPAIVAARVEYAYRSQLTGPLARFAAKVVRTLRPRIRVGVGGVGADVGAAPEGDVIRLLEQLLDLPVRLFERSGTRTLVVVDEFQEVLRASEAVEGAFRSRVQHHVREAADVFAGSQPGLMRELSDNRERPFFGQARPVPLEPLSDAPLAEYIETRFAAGRRGLVGDVLETLLETAAGHPQRAMMLAHHLWERTPDCGRADADTWAGALAAVEHELAEGSARTWERLTTNQARTLAALAGGEGSLFARQTLSRFGRTKSGAEHGRDGLIDSGEVWERGGRLEIVDPFLARWAQERGRPAPATVISSIATRDLTGDLHDLTRSQQIAVLRVVQEALANVREHSGAGAVDVTVREEAEHVRVQVVDNGRGFHPHASLRPAERQGRLGVVGMAERVRLLGGSFNLESTPGGPTSVTALVPRWWPAD